MNSVDQPFDQLRDTDTSGAVATPDHRFVRRLRARLEAELAPAVELPSRKETVMSDNQTSTETSTGSATDTPPQVITPYITVRDSAAAIDWYVEALGVTETMRFTGDDGRIGHAEIVINGARIFMSDAYPEIGVVAADSYEGSSCALHVEVSDVDTLHASAVGAGATSLQEPADQPHGARHSTIMDPFGHRWMFSQSIASPTIDEIDAATPGFTVEGTDAEAAPTRRPIQLGYYTIHSADIAKAASFYSHLFGWNVDPESGHVDNCDLPFGFQNKSDEGVRLWMNVDDPDAVIAAALELGATVIEDATYASGRAVALLDDQGARFDLHEPAPGYE